jgi:hypothetical protein
LLGGPLHRLGYRLGLVRDGTNTTALGLVLGASLWTVLLALALIEGLGHVLFSIAAIGAHVRLLVTIPLLFVCEAFVDPRFTEFVRGIVRSEVVPAIALPALESEIARVTRWKDAWLPEALLLLAALLSALTLQNENIFDFLAGMAGTSNPSAASTEAWTSHWYWLVCMTVFRFLLLRWLWRLALWSFFLWRVSRLELRLVPIHPDRAGGLGFLQVVHTEFIPLVLAISATLSATFAQGIASGRMTFDSLYTSAAIILAVDAVLFLGPLLIFSRKLWKCQVNGLNDYGAFAERYANEFDRKWLGAAEPELGASLLGTADIQSLADLSNSISIVRDMRIVPTNPRMLMYLTIAALLPLLPLLLLKYPIKDLLATFFNGLSGM